MNPPIVIFVEDDSTQAEYFSQAVSTYCATWRLVTPEIKIFPSEGVFLDALEASRQIADLYIFDLMLKWKDVGEEIRTAKPREYHADLAGLRCKDAVLQRFPAAKVLIWTMIETDHIAKERFKGCHLLRDKLEISTVMKLLKLS